MSLLRGASLSLLLLNAATTLVHAAILPRQALSSVAPFPILNTTSPQASDSLTRLSSGAAPGQSSILPAGSATPDSAVISGTQFNFGSPTLRTTTIIASGTTELVPVGLSMGERRPVIMCAMWCLRPSAPKASSGTFADPVILTTTLPATEFTSSASSASSQLVGLLPIISSWTNNPGDGKDSLLSNVEGVKSEIEDLLSQSGGSSSGGCPSKRKRELHKKDLIGNVVNEITGDLECAVAGLTKITDSINADDIRGVQNLVKGLTDVAADIGGESESDDDENSSTDDQQSSKTSSQDSSTTGSTSASSSDSSSSVSAPTPCASSNCGNACNLNPGPQTGAMNAASTSDSCAFISTVTTDSLPTASQGLYGTLTIDDPSPTEASGGSLSKRAHLVMPEDKIETGLFANISIRTLINPTNPQQYVSGLNPAWVSQVGSVSGTYYPFNSAFQATAGVNGIYGCTAVFVVSELGAFISHIWEDPVFLIHGTTTWETTSDDYFYQNSIQALLDGTATSESLTALQGTDDNPGPLHAIHAPRVLVVTPFTTDFDRNKLGITTDLHYQDRAYQIAQTLAARIPGSGGSGFVFGYQRTNPSTSTGPGWLGRAILEVDPFERWLTTPSNAANGPGWQIGRWRLWLQDVVVAGQEYWVPNTTPPNTAASKRDVGYPNPCAGSDPSSNSTNISSSSAFSSATSSGLSSFSTITSSGVSNGSSSSTASASAPYCVPFQDPDRGIDGYCQCSDGADYSFASGNNSCPYTSPGPASQSINPATVTGTVVQPSNPVPPITVLPSSTSDTPTSTSSSTAASDTLANHCRSVVDPPVCQTSDGSPLISDCSDFSDPSIDLSDVDLCAQPFGSGCQTVGTSGGCKLVLCQPDDFLGTEVCLTGGKSCVPYWVDQLIDKCGGDNGRVGGYISLPAGHGSDRYMNLEFTT